MSDSSVVSIGINKRKKSFKPTTNLKRPKPILQRKEITIDASNVDPSKSFTNTTQNNTTQTNVVQAKTTKTSPLKNKVREPLKKKVVSISISLPRNKSPEPVLEETSVSSSTTDKPLTMQDLNSFVVKASQKGPASLPIPTPVETMSQVSTPWFLCPVSELPSDPNTSYICGHRVEKDKIPSEEYLKDLTKTLTTKQQEGSFYNVENMVKKRKRDNIDEEENGLMSRRKTLLDVSKYDAELKDMYKKAPPPQSKDFYTAPVVPQVTIQDGEIVLDTSSLFVQRIPVPPENPTVNPRAPPGPPVTNRTKHFLSRNAQYVKRIWSPLELQVFYDGLSLYGTDFTKIASTIPEKDRLQVKKKYKLEEKKHPSKITEYLMKKRSAP